MKELEHEADFLAPDARKLVIGKTGDIVIFQPVSAFR